MLCQNKRKQNPNSTNPFILIPAPQSCSHCGSISRAPYRTGYYFCTEPATVFFFILLTTECRRMPKPISRFFALQTQEISLFLVLGFLKSMMLFFQLWSLILNTVFSAKLDFGKQILLFTSLEIHCTAVISPYGSVLKIRDHKEGFVRCQTCPIWGTMIRHMNFSMALQ